MTLLVKDPATRIEYEFDWSAAYPEGPAVTASEWSVEPDEVGGANIAASAHDASQSSVTLTGGIAGRVYRVINRVTLSDGQIDERSMSVRVEER